jgi:hypothetical protein
VIPHGKEERGEPVQPAGRDHPGVAALPAFRWLLSSLAVSQTGDRLYNLALVTMVYEGTHSAATGQKD